MALLISSEQFDLYIIISYCIDRLLLGSTRIQNESIMYNESCSLGLDNDYSTNEDFKVNRTLTESRIVKQFESISENGTKTVSIKHLSLKDCKNFCEDSSKLSHEICQQESICSTTCLEKSQEDKLLACKDCSLTLTCIEANKDFNGVKCNLLF